MIGLLDLANPLQDSNLRNNMKCRKIYMLKVVCHNVIYFNLNVQCLGVITLNHKM